MENAVGRELFDLAKETSIDIAGINIYLQALSIELHRRDPALAQGIITTIHTLSGTASTSEVATEGRKRALILAGQE